MARSTFSMFPPLPIFAVARRRRRHRVRGRTDRQSRADPDAVGRPDGEAAQEFCGDPTGKADRIDPALFDEAGLEAGL